MTVKTKRVIDSITFTPDEQNFLNSLAGLMENECKIHTNTCETCPFHDAHDCLGNYCEDIWKTMRHFAENGGIKRQEE